MFNKYLGVHAARASRTRRDELQSNKTRHETHKHVSVTLEEVDPSCNQVRARRGTFA